MVEIKLNETSSDFDKFLKYLELNRLLIRVKDKVNTEKDIGDYMYKSAVEGGPALLFENVVSEDLGISYDLQVVGSLICTRQRAAIAIGASEDQALQKCIDAQEHPLPPVVLDNDPVKRRIVKGDEIDLLRLLPVAKCSPKDGGKYIGTGVLFAKDPKLGRNAAISRHQVLGKNRLGILSVLPQHTAVFRTRAEERGEPLKVSISLGCAPDIIVSSQFKPPLGVDETGFAGGLRREPVRLVKGKTVDVEFPASAHIVIEGEIPIGVRQKEGPFGEYTGYYGNLWENQTVIDVKSLSIREDLEPVFYGSCPMPVENDVIKEIPMEATILHSLRRNSPGVLNVRCPWYGGCEEFVIVQLKKSYEDEGKVAILGALSSSGAHTKIVIVVDEDTNIFDDNEVFNAVTYRMQPGKDVTIVRTAGHVLDPSYLTKAPEGGFAMGIDATKPLSAGFPERIEDHRTTKKFPTFTTSDKLD